MPLLFIFSFLTGFGGCSGFSAAIKTGQFADTNEVHSIDEIQWPVISPTTEERLLHFPCRLLA